MSGSPLKFYEKPKIETGYIFNREKSFFSVVMPEESINLLHNPEVANLLTYAGVGVVAALSADEQYVGLNSLTGNMPNNSYLYTGVLTALTPGQTYTFSVSVKSQGNGNFQYVLQLINGATNTVVSTSKRFDANTMWERNSFSFVIPAGGILQPRLAVRRVDGGTANRILFVDAWQLEQGDYDTTFISGSLTGFIPGEVPRPYYWVNTPHYSQSVRRQNTNSGGRIISLESVGFQVTGFSGFGLPDFDIESSELASRFNSVYWNSIVKERDVEICGTILAKNPKDFFKIRAELAKIFSNNLYDKPQPIKFIYQLYDCDKAICDCVEFTAFYESGLSGDIESIVGEEICISLKMLDITFKSCREVSRTFDATTSSFASNFIGTKTSGEWRSFPSIGTQYWADNFQGAWLDKAAIEIGPDGNLYVGGRENSLAVQGEAALKRWNGVSWDNIGFLTRAPGYPGNLYAGDLRHQIYCLLTGPDNKLYIGGRFIAIRNQSGTSSVSIFDGLPANPAPPADQFFSLNFVRYDIATDTFEYIGKFLNNPALGPINSTAPDALINFAVSSVHSLKLMRDGRILIGGKFTRPRNAAGIGNNDGHGTIYNIETNSFDRITDLLPNVSVGPVLGRTRVLTVEEGSDGDLWFGGYDIYGVATLSGQYVGVARLSRQTGRLENACLTQRCGLIGPYAGAPVTTNLASVYKLMFDLNGVLWACGDFYADEAFANARPPLPFDFNRVTVRDSSIKNAVPSVSFGFAKLVTGAWPGLVGWSSPGIIGRTNNFALQGPNKWILDGRLGRVYDMDLDESGNIHLVGNFNYASTALPNKDYLALPIVSPFDFENTIDQALSTQEPNVGGYTIWDGTSFKIPDILLYNSNVPDLIPYVTTVKTSARFGRRYTQNVLTNTIPAFQYTFDTADEFAVDFSDNVYLHHVTPAEIFLFPTDMYYRPVINKINLDCANFAKPVIVFRGPGILRSIQNKTTGAKLEFNKKFESNEFAVLDLRGDFFSFKSNLEGDIRYTILPNSQLSNFNLVPGENIIVAFFQPNTTSSTTKITVTWKNEYLSIDSGCQCEGVENV